MCLSRTNSKRMNLSFRRSNTKTAPYIQYCMYTTRNRIKKYSFQLSPSFFTTVVYCILFFGFESQRRSCSNEREAWPGCKKRLRKMDRLSVKNGKIHSLTMVTWHRWGEVSAESFVICRTTNPWLVWMS